VVRGGGRFELEESKGEAPDMEEGAESHRGGAAPVGWRLRTVTVACFGGGRHLQHRRGEVVVRGKSNWLEMDPRWRSLMRGGCDGGGSKSIVPGGGFPMARWTNGKGGV
jgi:hypothetical protein